MVGAVHDANADAEGMGFLTTPLMASLLSRTLVAASAGSDMLWQGPLNDGRVLGYRALSTNQVSKTMTGSEATGGSAHGIVFGNFSDLVLGLFGALEIVVDPYALKKRGIIEVTSFQMLDIILRHGESFAKGTGATLT